MAGFPKKERQAIINDYLHASGRNQFVPAEFLDWLRDKPDHKAHSIFYGMSDEEAADAHRLNLVRQWVSGLRITVQTKTSKPVAVGRVKVNEVELPAMISPVAKRKSGGGYVAVDPSDDDTMTELAAQAAADLERWVERYGGAASLLKVNTAPIKQIARSLRTAGVAQAA